MKKLFALVLVTALVLSACSGGGGGTAQQPASGSGATTAAEPAQTGPSGNLVFWADNDDWANALMDGFRAKYPNVTFEYENIAHTESRAKVSLDGPAGIGPDVFHYPHDHAAIAIQDGTVEPFPADMASRLNSAILDAAIKTVTYNGRLYGAPFQTENIALFYNKDFVDTPPATFEEIIEFAKTFNEPASNKFAMRWQINDAYHNYLFLNAFGFTVFGPNMDDYRQPGFDHPGVAQGLRFHNSLKEVFPFSTDDADWDATVAAFQRGETAFTISGPWAIQDAISNGTNFGITKIPTINGVQPRCFSGARIMNVSSFAKNFDAAFAFVEYVVSEEGAAILYNVTGNLPALKDISHIAGLSDDEYLMGIQKQSPFADPMPVIPEVHAMWEPLAELFTFSWNGDLTPEGAQAKAMETYEILLAGMGKSIND
jgi:arabinogalactan oligomer/maltooligosaccharide transport system substrate-binding protein